MGPLLFWGIDRCRYNLPWQFLNLKSPPFSFQVNPAPLFHGRNPLVKTDERSVTTDWRAECSHAFHPSVASRNGGNCACSSYASSVIRLPNRRLVNYHPSALADSYYPCSHLSTQHGVWSLDRLDHLLFYDDDVSFDFFCLFLLLLFVISFQFSWVSMT
jgi:hypothetical protein